MDFKLDTNKTRKLSDNELKDIAGGGRLGNPMCPRCYNTNVVFNARFGAVSYCKACGYTNE